MTVDQHHTSDEPNPGDTREELIQGTLTLSTGTASETISLNLSYSSKPIINATAGAGSTGESVTASLVDDDPTSDGNITVRVDGATNEDKEYHVHVVDLLGGE